MRSFGSGSSLGTWALAGALLCACVQGADPRIWFGAATLPIDMVAALAKGALGGIVGALLGVALGVVVTQSQRLRFSSTRVRRGGPSATGVIVSALVLGLGCAGYELSSAPLRVQAQACATMRADVTDAQRALSDGGFARAQALVDQALDARATCGDSSVMKPVLGALYVLRGAAFYQRDPGGTRSGPDFDQAQAYLAACSQPEANVDAPLCATYLEVLGRYRAEHFCAQAQATTNRAYNARLQHPELARELASSALEFAGKCRNRFAYAYRGLALAELAAAQTALGATQSARENRRVAHGLLARCEDELQALDASSGLVTACRGAQRALVTAEGGVP